MPSFILRNLDPDFWGRVQAKAKAEHTSVYDLIIRLLSAWLAAILLLSTIACGKELVTAPSGVQQPAAGVPTRMELSANPGIGTEGGTGTIIARVFDRFSAALAQQTVTFTADAGTLGAGQAVTDEKGFARTTISGPAGSIRITATTGAIEMKALLAMQPVPAGAPEFPPLTQPELPKPTPPPPPPPPVPSYGVTVVASPASLVLNGSSTLTATVTAVNGAPMPPTTFAWDCDGNGTAEIPNGSNSQACTYTTSGPVKSRVTVSTGTVSGSGAVDVTVAAAAPLFVSISIPTPSPVVANVDSTYTGTVSSSGSIPASLQWEWDEDGDGTADAFATGGSFNSRAIGFTSTGPHTVKLTVRDPATGRTASTSRSVTVQ
jgi:hypothetical protein